MAMDDSVASVIRREICRFLMLSAQILRTTGSVLARKASMADSWASKHWKQQACKAFFKSASTLLAACRSSSSLESSSPLTNGKLGNCSSNRSKCCCASSVALSSSALLKVSASSCNPFINLCKAMAREPWARSQSASPQAPWSPKSLAAKLVSKCAKVTVLTGSNMVANLPGSTYPLISGIFSRQASSAALCIRSTVASAASRSCELARRLSCHRSQHLTRNAFLASPTTSAQNGKPSSCCATETADEKASSREAMRSFSQPANLSSLKHLPISGNLA
mmetsp:Transcript_75003/g.243771  ORF Transcript_75003/g.243771 Transcript_75003/m.243771 type:complete len:279 (-) Transcript_75003:2476-3312(-)